MKQDHPGFPTCAELADACERLLSEGRALELDFTGMSFLVRNGVELVARLKSRGAAVAGCSPFVEQQLTSGLEAGELARDFDAAGRARRIPGTMHDGAKGGRQARTLFPRDHLGSRLYLG